MKNPAINETVIRDLNSSILQAAEIQNRIKKVQQLEKSPLVDNYGSINEPHAHPYGIMSGLTANALKSNLGSRDSGVFHETNDLSNRDNEISISQGNLPGLQGQQ